MFLASKIMKIFVLPLSLKSNYLKTHLLDC